MADITHISQLTQQGEGKNARRHNPRNIGMIASALQEVGAARSIVIDEAGEILAGNGTWEAAGQVGIERVRVIDADGDELIAVRRRNLTPEQKVRLALADNRASDLSEWDFAVLAGYLDTPNNLQGVFTDKEMAAIEELAKAQSEEGQSDEDKPLKRSDVPDALFPSDNEWGVPLLDAKKQASFLDLPCKKWGAQARTGRMQGTWHFYTDDYKFQALWDDPTPVINSQCKNAIEPNFSTSDNMPRAVALWKTYQKRWIARYWQEYGVKVLVDLNVMPQFADLNLLGVPKGWRAYATRALVKYADMIEVDYQTACEHAGTEDILFVVVGGRSSVEKLCQERGWLYVLEDSALARKNGVGDGQE